MGGVTPGKGGTRVEGFPVFDNMDQCVEQTGAEASMVFVPATRAKDAAFEAIQAGIKLLVIITEGIPVHDMIHIKNAAQRYSVAVIGPNTPGIVVPQEAKLGIAPGEVFSPGFVGVVSRSGTLTYEAVCQLSGLGLGQSAVVGIGGDPLPGTGMTEVLDLFEADSNTRSILLIGEIGGYEEQHAAVHVARAISKPVTAYIAGATAPMEKRLGHAGAIVRKRAEGYGEKVRALQAAGIQVADQLDGIGNLVKQSL
jgi:succinyl-CoA synthetase alpha subunit